MKVGIFGQSNNETTIKYAKTLMDLLRERNIDFVVEENFGRSYAQVQENHLKFFSGYDDLDPKLDFFFTIGGDGTFLRAVTLIRDHRIPILGINTGRLGFLATVPKDKIEEAIENISQGAFKIRKRVLLEVEVEGESPPFEGLNFALNEVSVSRKNTASMIKADTYLDDEFLTTYWSDGLIISTPTGSTGYSMSCGGPIISPSSKNVVLTPIAPHSLAVRPLVIPQQTQIELKIDSRADEILLTLDSRMHTLSNNSKIFIKKCKFSVRTVQLQDQTFIKTLRKKLLWGEDLRN